MSRLNLVQEETYIVAIQMYERRPPYGFFGPEHFSGTLCPTLMIFGMLVGLGPKGRTLTFGVAYANQVPNLHNLFKKLSGAFLGNRMPYLDDIWFVRGVRAEGAYAEFWAWHMLVPWDCQGQKC